MLFCFREMERREVQLQPQPYYGIAGVIARPTPIQFQQSDAAANYYGGVDLPEEIRAAADKQQPFRISSFHQPQPKQQYYCEPTNPDVTATIFPTPRYSGSSFRKSFNPGRGGRHSGRGGVPRAANSDDGQPHEKPELFEWHSR